MIDLSHTAIIAGQGRLPELLAQACRTGGADHRIVAIAGAAPDWAKADPATLPAQFERLGALFSDLKEAGITKLIFAGAITRPVLDPTKADAAFAAIAPRLMAALGQGDDATLRFILSVFEDAGFEIVAAQDALPSLLCGPCLIGGSQPDDALKADATRALAIARKLGEADVGQGAVVAGGICLGVETIGGTDRMLAGLSDLPAPLRGTGGVLVKTPKPGQDPRVDMPAIGPDTVSRAAAAGLAGVAISAGQVLVLDSAEIAARAQETGLCVWAMER